MRMSCNLNSGKTSLLFQFAFNVALHSNNSHVLFISNRHSFDSKPPFLSQVIMLSLLSSLSFLYFTFLVFSRFQGIDPSSHVFHRIQMKYMNDDEDISKYFAAFHLHDTLPAAVIIDDFGHFFHTKYDFLFTFPLPFTT